MAEKVLPHVGPAELVVVLVLALVIFGPGKLPQLGKAVGQSIREFNQAMHARKEEGNDEPSKG